jgi:hypothetical protein
MDAKNSMFSNAMALQLSKGKRVLMRFQPLLKLRVN